MEKFDIKQAYYLYYLIRKSEEKIIELYPTDKIKSPVHLSNGQEAVAVGVNMALAKEDIVFSNYRGHAHYIARGGSLEKFWSELYGKSSGTAHGKAGSMHLGDHEVNFMTTSAIVASSIPQAVGYAYAQKYLDNQGIVVCFHGDGAVDEGVYWESLNFAALHKLPILFVCENNKYAIYTHQERRMAKTNITEKAETFGVSAFDLGYANTEKIYKKTLRILESIKEKNQPYLIECETTRFMDHVGVQSDKWLDYRSDKNLDDAIKDDEIFKLESLLNKDTVNDIQKRALDNINSAMSYAEMSDYPSEDQLTGDVYG